MSSQFGFNWREWNHGTRAGVSGWDPNNSPAFNGGMLCMFGSAVLFSLGTDWIFCLLLFAFGVMWGWTSRYHLVISKDGYWLWRTCFLILPWSVRRFSKRAVVFIEDDFGDDVCLGICEPAESFEEWVCVGEPPPILFGTRTDVQMVLHRIVTLAFQLGCRSTPPGDDPTVIKIAVPKMPRRMKRMARKSTDENL